MGNRSAETPTRRALSACRNITGVHRHCPSCHRRLGRTLLDTSVSPLAPRALTRASLATVHTRTCIRQAASDLAIHRGLPRTMTVTRQLVVDANGGSRCRVHNQMWLHILRGARRIQGLVDELSTPDILALGLKKRDRLEPWTGLQDIGDEFDQLQPTAARPVRVCFWCRSEETATRHRSPLLDTGLHTSVNSLMIDILHTWFLGIHQRFLGWV